SDLGQWMLKVVFSHQLQPPLRVTAPLEHVRIDEPVVNATALAKVAGVSVASAFRLVASLKAERYLVDDDAVLRPIRVEELLGHWRTAFRRRPSEIRARWLFPPKDSSKQLDELLRKH